MMKQRRRDQKKAVFLLASLAVAAGLLEAAAGLKMAVMSDLHILPMYSPEVNNTCYCSVGCPGQNYLIPKDMQSS